MPYDYSHAQKWAERAIENDRKGDFTIALFCYNEALHHITLDIKKLTNLDQKSALKKLSSSYEERVNLIAHYDKNRLATSPSSEIISTDLKLWNFIVRMALYEDEQGNRDTATELYAKAADHALRKLKDVCDSEIEAKIKDVLTKALERAEYLKNDEIKSHAKIPDHPKPANATVTSSQPSEQTYTAEEKSVLLATSRINNRQYVPFLSIDLEEKFNYPIPFTDKDGHLVLSPKQMEKFSRWARPDEICADPKLIEGSCVNYETIRQSVITDCSFVASMTVAALYEQKFNTRLITSIIYPKKKDGVPRYNPSGKYMIKFNINGITRKIIIDDYLPVSRNNRLLCSHSSNKNELWPSLLEKAYMKVMGGYNFPGSQSSIDLHALTGWIPEQYILKVEAEEGRSLDSVFDSLLQRIHKGDALVTAATSQMTAAEADRAGLAETHAYAVIDIRKIDGSRLLKLKNPWSTVRWKGNYSELDKDHWTEDMKARLGYDPEIAAKCDNGIFWIDYESLQKYFRSFHVSWNPKMFPHRFSLHQSWSANKGPAKDVYDVSENPQFNLDVLGCKVGAVWILLTRHITELHDFAENKVFITLDVYTNDGKRVYYPDHPPPYMIGKRINSPHYLCKVILSEKSPSNFTLVVSQLEKMSTIHFTITAYSTCPFKLSKLVDVYKYEQQFSGKWNANTAGGSREHVETFERNPKYEVVVTSTSLAGDHLLFLLKGPKEYCVGLDVRLTQMDDETETANFHTKSSDVYRQGFVVLEINNAQKGKYVVIPSTFHSNQEGPFILIVKSSCTVKVTKLN